MAGPSSASTASLPGSDHEQQTGPDGRQHRGVPVSRGARRLAVGDCASGAIGASRRCGAVPLRGGEAVVPSCHARERARRLRRRRARMLGRAVGRAPAAEEIEYLPPPTAHVGQRVPIAATTTGTFGGGGSAHAQRADDSTPEHAERDGGEGRRARSRAWQEGTTASPPRRGTAPQRRDAPIAPLAQSPTARRRAPRDTGRHGAAAVPAQSAVHGSNPGSDAVDADDGPGPSPCSWSPRVAGRSPPVSTATRTSSGRRLACREGHRRRAGPDGPGPRVRRGAPPRGATRLLGIVPACGWASCSRAPATPRSCSLAPSSPEGRSTPRIQRLILDRDEDRKAWTERLARGGPP